MFSSKLNKCRKKLTVGSREYFSKNMNELIKTKEMLRKHMQVRMDHVAVYWKQWTRVKWLMERDRNTMFVKLTTISRSIRNHICRMKGKTGSS